MTWLPSAIFKVSAVKDVDKPQICISLTWLLIIIDLQYLPQIYVFDVGKSWLITYKYLALQKSQWSQWKSQNTR